MRIRRQAKNKYLMLKVLKELSGKSAAFPEFEDDDEFNPFRRQTQDSIDNYKDNEDDEMAEDQRTNLLDSSPSNEQQQHRKNKLLPSLIIFHYSPFKMGWDWITLILVLYTAVFTPFMAAFTLKLSSKNSVHSIPPISSNTSTQRFNYLPQPSKDQLINITNITIDHAVLPKPYVNPDAGWMEFLNAVEVFVDIMFVLDILINFRTTYIDDGEVVVNPKKIAINYMKGWFIIDAVAAVPFDYILYGAGSGDTLTQGITGILKTARLLRLLRVARKIDQYSEYGAAVLVLLMATFTLMAHWLACLFYAITTFERSRVLQAPIGWLDSLARQHGITFMVNGTEPDTKSRYITALYFTFTILTSVGFGNVAPVTNYEKVFTIFAMLLGSLMSAAIFGNVSSIMLRLYRGTEEYHEMLASIKEFIKFHYFPKPLANRLIESYQNARAFANGVDMNCVLKSFPECLQADICLHLNKTLLNNCPLFKNASPGCLRALSMKFKSLHAPTGDTLIHPGDVLDSLYFVTRGSIEILKEDTIMAILGKDDIFGKDVRQSQSNDKKLVSKSAFSVRAMSYAEMHKISLDDLMVIFSSYPDFAYDFTLKFEVTFDIKLDTNVTISDKDEEMLRFIEVRRRKSQYPEDAKKPQVIANGYHKFIQEEIKHSTPKILEESSQHSTLSKVESLKFERQREMNTSLSQDNNSKPDRTISQIGTSKSPSSSVRTSNLPRLPRVIEMLPVLGDVFSDEAKFSTDIVRHVSPSTASYAPKSSFSTAGIPSSCSLPQESEEMSGGTKNDAEDQPTNGIPTKFLKDVDLRLKKINKRMGKFENELCSTIDAILKALGYNPQADRQVEDNALVSPYFAYRSNQQHIPGVYGSTHLLGVSPVIYEPPLMSP